jgi:hypothetical protein
VGTPIEAQLQLYYKSCLHGIHIKEITTDIFSVLLMQKQKAVMARVME